MFHTTLNNTVWGLNDNLARQQAAEEIAAFSALSTSEKGKVLHTNATSGNLEWITLPSNTANVETIKLFYSTSYKNIWQTESLTCAELWDMLPNKKLIFETDNNSDPSSYTTANTYRGGTLINARKITAGNTVLYVFIVYLGNSLILRLGGYSNEKCHEITDAV